MPRVLRHLDQLKPVLQRNSDVIAFVQAGFVGAWGEWHNSSNDLTATATRLQIKDALLAAVPRDRFVQFRYPPHVIGWAPRLPTLAAALTGRFRIGFHNDCFLASTTDVGTYPEDIAERAGQQSYIAQLSALSPFGGETCNPVDDSGAEPRTGCAAILGEGLRYRLTYLNAAYYRPLFHERWIAERCMNEVQARMGYRFVLEALSHPSIAKRGQPMDLALSVRNAGWARLYNPRRVTVLLRSANSLYRVVAVEADPRSWLPGAFTRETLRVTLPRTLPLGRYRISLALPDAGPRIARDSRFSVRFANADDPGRGQGWDASTGAFDTGTTLTVE